MRDSLAAEAQLIMDDDNERLNGRKGAKSLMHDTTLLYLHGTGLEHINNYQLMLAFSYHTKTKM